MYSEKGSDDESREENPYDTLFGESMRSRGGPANQARNRTVSMNQRSRLNSSGENSSSDAASLHASGRSLADRHQHYIRGKESDTVSVASQTTDSSSVARPLYGRSHNRRASLTSCDSSSVGLTQFGTMRRASMASEDSSLLADMESVFRAQSRPNGNESVSNERTKSRNTLPLDYEEKQSHDILKLANGQVDSSRIVSRRAMPVEASEYGEDDGAGDFSRGRISTNCHVLGSSKGSRRHNFTESGPRRSDGDVGRHFKHEKLRTERATSETISTIRFARGNVERPVPYTQDSDDEPDNQHRLLLESRRGRRSTPSMACAFDETQGGPLVSAVSVGRAPIATAAKLPERAPSFIVSRNAILNGEAQLQECSIPAPEPVAAYVSQSRTKSDRAARMEKRFERDREKSRTSKTGDEKSRGSSRRSQKSSGSSSRRRIENRERNGSDTKLSSSFRSHLDQDLDDEDRISNLMERARSMAVAVGAPALQECSIPAPNMEEFPYCSASTSHRARKGSASRRATDCSEHQPREDNGRQHRSRRSASKQAILNHPSANDQHSFGL